MPSVYSVVLYTETRNLNAEYAEEASNPLKRGLTLRWLGGIARQIAEL